MKRQHFSPNIVRGGRILSRFFLIFWLKILRACKTVCMVDNILDILNHIMYADDLVSSYRWSPAAPSHMFSSWCGTYTHGYRTKEINT